MGEKIRVRDAEVASCNRTATARLASGSAPAGLARSCARDFAAQGFPFSRFSTRGCSRCRRRRAAARSCSLFTKATGLGGGSQSVIGITSPGQALVLRPLGFGAALRQDLAGEGFPVAKRFHQELFAMR